jgi:4a-hydroxytetrahydrobiopterin dehydratase
MADLIDAHTLTTRLTDLPAWNGDTSAIRREVDAPDFMTAIRIVDAIAEVAEQMDHHPDIDIRWKRLTFACSTHSAGGVTERDFELARRIDEVVTANGA